MSHTKTDLNHTELKIQGENIMYILLYIGVK